LAAILVYNNKQEHIMENENSNRKCKCGSEKVILFIIGTLLGAVIASSAFLISANVLIDKNSNSGSQQSQQGGTPPDMPNGQSCQSGQNQPPEKPSSEESN
jgi:hypothetical protein